MRWDRFFDDLEAQFASEWEAERAALDSEAERLRLSRVPLRDRITALADRERTGSSPSFEFADGTVLVAEVSGVGADWVALEPNDSRAGAVLTPVASIVAIGAGHADILRSARPSEPRSSLTARMSFGFVLRDLVRRRAAVGIHLATGRALTGTIDRAGSDHLDLALHEQGTPRRASAVIGHRLIPFAAIAWMRLDAPPGVI